MSRKYRASGIERFSMDFSRINFRIYCLEVRLLYVFNIALINGFERIAGF